MILASVFIGLQLLAAVLVFVGGFGSRKMNEKKPLFRFAEEKENGDAVWKPYWDLRYKHPAFLQLLKGHYLSKRPDEIEEAKPFASKRAKALYELQTGKAQLSRFMGEDFWDEWETMRQTNPNLPAVGTIQQV